MNKRKTIAVAFLAFILIPLFFSGGLQLFQVYLKHRAEKRLDTETLADLKFPLHTVQWVEEGREIKVDGKMYDLESYHEAGGFLYGKGVHDEHESQVMNLLSDFNEKDQDNFIIRVLLLSQSIAVSIILVTIAFGINGLKRPFTLYTRKKVATFYKKIYQPPRLHYPH
ncbi:MAG: hypothetical protein ACXWB9_01260 [Flavisolibacter sp.]